MKDRQWSKKILSDLPRVERSPISLVDTGVDDYGIGLGERLDLSKEAMKRPCEKRFQIRSLPAWAQTDTGPRDR